MLAYIRVIKFRRLLRMLTIILFKFYTQGISISHCILSIPPTLLRVLSTPPALKVRRYYRWFYNNNTIHNTNGDERYKINCSVVVSLKVGNSCSNRSCKLTQLRKRNYFKTDCLRVVRQPHLTVATTTTT